jgi:hypothetical protein
VDVGAAKAVERLLGVADEQQRRGAHVVGHAPQEGLNGNACLGYVLNDSGALIAVLMPADYTPGTRDAELYFQFNEE